MVGSGRRRVNFTSKNRKMQMNDPWARGPIGKLREKATLRARRPRWRPRWSSNFAWPPPFPVQNEKGEKGSERDSEKNEEEKETGGRKKKGTGKRTVKAAKGREEGRALHHRACRPFRRGVWLRDIKMC